MKTYRFILFLVVLSTFSVLHAREITVDSAGNGDFTSIQEAINSLRVFDPEGWMIINIKKGVYKEKVEIPTYATHIHLKGEAVNETVLVWYDHAKINSMGTFKTYTLKVSGSDIIFENLTIENAAEPIAQAVAVHVEGDRIMFTQCRLLGNQDTYYGGRAGCRQFFYRCYIEGTTDYIFGPSVAWFEQCRLHSKRNSYITAASTPQEQLYGFIFNNCTLSLKEGVDKVYLGRPWRPYAMTVFRNCELPEGILQAGWDNWRNPENENTARYAEYRNTGVGADRSHRVEWSVKLTCTQARRLTIERVLQGTDNWKAYMELIRN